MTRKTREVKRDREREGKKSPNKSYHFRIYDDKYLLWTCSTTLLDFYEWNLKDKHVLNMKCYANKWLAPQSPIRNHRRHLLRNLLLLVWVIPVWRSFLFYRFSSFSENQAQKTIYRMSRNWIEYLSHFFFLEFYFLCSMMSFFFSYSMLCVCVNMTNSVEKLFRNRQCEQQTSIRSNEMRK